MKDPIKEATELARKYGVDGGTVLLLKYCRALKGKRYRTAERIHDAVTGTKSKIKIKKMVTTEEYADGLIGLDPTVSFICKLGEAMKGATVVTRKRGYVEVYFPGFNSIDVYKHDIQLWVSMHRMDEAFIKQEAMVSEGMDAGLSDAVDRITDDYWDSEAKLIEFAKFELGI